MGVRKSVCLVMIVKDEARRIRPCLEALRGWVDTWVVCDTGSKDGTQAMVRECLSGIPGKLHQVPWVDFGHNRTHALTLARGAADYHLIVDADMIFQQKGEFRQGLEADSYLVRERAQEECWVERLISDRHDWTHVGSVRPFLHSKTSVTRAKLLQPSFEKAFELKPDASMLHYKIALLERSLERGENIPRATFHLAQNYRDLGNLPRAIEFYEKRATLGGWPEEIWYSLYQVARLQQRLGISWVLVLSQYLRAYQFRPQRVESLFRVAEFYRSRGESHLADVFSNACKGRPYPDDLLFIEPEAYTTKG